MVTDATLPRGLFSAKSWHIGARGRLFVRRSLVVVQGPVEERSVARR